MEPVEEDPRFAHVASDPRFKPMPKSKKKVKIDSRFQSLFTNKHFSHRMDMDKRGRPTLNRSKKNKNTMERFYELSSSDSSDVDEDEESNDEEPVDDSKQNDSHNVESEMVQTNDMTETTNSKNKKNKKSTTSPMLSAKKLKALENGAEAVKDENKSSRPKLKKSEKKRKQAPSDGDANVTKKKKVMMADQESDDTEESCSDDNIEIASDDGEFENDKIDVQDNSSDGDDSDEGDLPIYSADFDLEETDHQWNELEKDALETSESTRRLAVCNMDWDFVKAQDLFVLFRSFVPEGGILKSVAIYPSEFGKERMAEEVKMGPKEIREHTLKRQEEKAAKKKKGKKIDEQKEKSLKKSIEEEQTEKLREYQLNRLKYYYAVVECDSVSTADNIYTECDGREYQLSSVRLDLRFIPDDMTFDDEPREVFSENQTIVDYQPTSFESTALCNAKVEVTWDETEFDRLSRRVGVMQQKDLENIIEENKYSDIIAPPESDSDEEEGRPEWLETALAQQSDEDSEEGEDSEQTKKKKTLSEEDKIKLYRQLLVDKLAEEEEEKEKEENDVDKVLEWTPGLKSDAKKKLKKKEKNDEEAALVNDYLEKRREKKKKKRNLKKQQMVAEEDAVSEEDDLMDIDDSLKEMMQGEEVYEDLNKEKKKKKKKKRTEEENKDDDDKERAELELMLMDDDDTKHFSKPEIVDDNESKSKKKRKSKKAMAKQKLSQEQEIEKEDYVMDVEDKRFGALFSSHHFHIDPTAPQFKKTKNMMRLVDEQIKRKKTVKKGNSDEDKNGHSSSSGGVKSSKAVSQSLVESLKKKMKKT